MDFLPSCAYSIPNKQGAEATVEVDADDAASVAITFV